MTQLIHVRQNSAHPFRRHRRHRHERHRRGAAEPRLQGFRLRPEEFRRHAAAGQSGRDHVRRPSRRKYRRRGSRGHQFRNCGGESRSHRSAQAAHPGDPARRDAGRVDAPEIRHRHRRHARQDDDHFDGGGGAGRGRARSHGRRRRTRRRHGLERAPGQVAIPGGRGRRERPVAFSSCPQYFRSSPTSTASTWTATATCAT